MIVCEGPCGEGKKPSRITATTDITMATKTRPRTALHPRPAFLIAKRLSPNGHRPCGRTRIPHVFLKNLFQESLHAPAPLTDDSTDHHLVRIIVHSSTEERTAVSKAVFSVPVREVAPPFFLIKRCTKLLVEEPLSRCQSQHDTCLAASRPPKPRYVS